MGLWCTEGSCQRAHAQTYQPRSQHRSSALKITRPVSERDSFAHYELQSVGLRAGRPGHLGVEALGAIFLYLAKAGGAFCLFVFLFSCFFSPLFFQQVPSLQSPSASLQPEGTVFTLLLPYSRAPRFTHLVTQFLWLPPRGLPLIVWLWRPERLAFLGPTGL